MYVLTIDQQASRRGTDRVPALIEALAGAADVSTVLGAERTVGDEVQLVVADPGAVVATVALTTRLGGWTVGIGAGAVDQPLPASTRAARGQAFSVARDAVERAKRVPARLAVSGGTDPYAAEHAEAALWLLVAVEGRRSRRGREVVEMRRASGSQRATARALGVSEQAISQVLHAAGWTQAERGRDLARWLLGRMLRPVPGGGGSAPT